MSIFMMHLNVVQYKIVGTCLCMLQYVCLIVILPVLNAEEVQELGPLVLTLLPILG
jgi:hypothetical protein